MNKVPLPTERPRDEYEANPFYPANSVYQEFGRQLFDLGLENDEVTLVLDLMPTRYSGDFQEDLRKSVHDTPEPTMKDLWSKTENTVVAWLDLLLVSHPNHAAHGVRPLVNGKARQSRAWQAPQHPDDYEPDTGKRFAKIIQSINLKPDM